MKDLHIYLRVSSEIQSSDGFGLENQKDLGLKVSKQKGMNPIIHNEGSQSSHSDSIDDRPILRNLLTSMEEGVIKNLWVYQMDRLSRNDVVSFRIRQTIKKNNVKLFVNSSTEYQLDNPNDKLMFTIMEGFSEFDNSIRTERLRRGKLSKIKTGGWKGGPPPYGYELKDGKLVPHKIERKWVKTIYEEYSNGTSIYDIQKILMRNGVVSRRGNLLWNEHSIRKILQNTHFEGYYTYTDKKLEETVRCEVPKILTSSLIKRVRDRTKTQTFTSNYIKRNTLLKDFLECGHCGSKFGQRINKVQYHSHYYCRGNTERLRSVGLQKEKVCSMENGRVRSILIDDSDTMIWDSVIKIISESNLFKEQFKIDVMGEVPSFTCSSDQRKLIQKQIKKLDEKIEMIKDSQNTIYVRGIIDKDDKDLKSIQKKFEEERLKIETLKEDLMESLSQNQKNQKWYNWIQEFKDKIDNLKTEEMTLEDKKKFLDGVIDKIVVRTMDKRSHQLEIIFQSPIVSDKLKWNEKGNPKKGYQIIKGKNGSSIEMDSSDKRQKKTITE